MLSRAGEWVRPLRYEIDRRLYNRTDHAQRLLTLKDSCKTRPMLVVGNGPSLNDTPLDEFAGTPAIGTNKINLIFPRTSWRPSMILCMNRHVMRQNQDWFATTEIPVFYSWQSRWFISKENRNTASYFLNLTTPDFSTDITSGVGLAWTITYAALQFAYYAGADPVILVGIDHSFATKGPANKLVINPGDDVNHFDPGYFPAGTAWNLPDLQASEDAYRRARIAFENSGRSILDATTGGRLDIFDKISVDEALALCKAN